MGNKYGQKLLDTTTRSTTDPLKTSRKIAIQKTVEATGDLVGNKITDKITKAAKRNTHKDLRKSTTAKMPPTTSILKEIYLSLLKQQQVIDELHYYDYKYTEKKQ